MSPRLSPIPTPKSHAGLVSMLETLLSRSVVKTIKGNYNTEARSGEIKQAYGLYLYMATLVAPTVGGLSRQRLDVFLLKLLAEACLIRNCVASHTLYWASSGGMEEEEGAAVWCLLIADFVF